MKTKGFYMLKGELILTWLQVFNWLWELVRINRYVVQTQFVTFECWIK